MLRLLVLTVLAATIPQQAPLLRPQTVVPVNGDAPMTGPETQAQLQGTWTIVAVANATIPPDVVPTLVFEPGRLAGFAGCNNFGVDLAVGDGGALSKAGGLVLTRKACGQAAMAVEAQVVRALERVNAVTFDGPDRLRLTAYGTALITAERTR